MVRNVLGFLVSNARWEIPFLIFQMSIESEDFVEGQGLEHQARHQAFLLKSFRTRSLGFHGQNSFHLFLGHDLNDFRGD